MRLALMALACALLAAPTARADAVDETIAVEPGGLLEFDLDLGEGMRPDPGKIEIVSRDADEVRVRVETSGWGSSAVRFRIEQVAGAVRVDGAVEGAFSWLFGGPQVRVRIWVPREFSIDARSTAASIYIEDVRGDVRARTDDADVEVVAVEGALRIRIDEGNARVSEVTGEVDVAVGEGEIEMRWITGGVEARTGDGDVELSHVKGAIEVRTDDGGIELRGIDGVVEAKSESGPLFASFSGAPEGVLETRRGSVEVVLPSHSGAQLDALTRHGAVEVGAGLDAPPEIEEDHLSGPLNGGGAPLRLYTARGSIRLRAH